MKNLKKKLDELIPMLASPIPSPDVNAPSPSPDSDIELPDEDMAVTNLSQSMIAPPTMYGSYGQDYDLTATTEAIHAANDFSPNFSSFMGGNMDFDMVVFGMFSLIIRIFSLTLLFDVFAEEFVQRQVGHEPTVRGSYSGIYLTQV